MKTYKFELRFVDNITNYSNVKDLDNYLVVVSQEMTKSLERTYTLVPVWEKVDGTYFLYTIDEDMINYNEYEHNPHKGRKGVEDYLMYVLENEYDKYRCNIYEEDL